MSNKALLIKLPFEMQEKISLVQTIFNNCCGTTQEDWTYEETIFVGERWGILCTLLPVLNDNSGDIIDAAFKVLSIPLAVVSEINTNSPRVALCAIPNSGLYINLLLPQNNSYWRADEAQGHCYSHTAEPF